MHYVLAIKSPVYGGQGAYLAYQFANALLAKQHQISQIFFFKMGSVMEMAWLILLVMSSI